MSKSASIQERDITIRGIIIGVVGCIVITATSTYVALKLGALPWPIVFAAIVSLFFLKLLGRTNYHEVNVTHTIMSAGAMVAGGLAFTIPGIWMTTGETPDFVTVLLIALAGVALGLAASGVLRGHFIERSHLEFPIGEAAAQTIVAGNIGGKFAGKLFGAMGISMVYTVLRDIVGAIPVLPLSNIAVPGIAFGIYNSPMLLAVGFIVGTVPVFVWFAGAVLGNFGLILGASELGLWDIATGQGIVQCLGMGLMLGCGIAIVVMNGIAFLRNRRKASEAADAADTADGTDGAIAADVEAAVAETAAATEPAPEAPAASTPRSRHGKTIFSIAAMAFALVICLILQLGPVASVIIVLLAWVTCAMAAMSVGQTGIDPMEIFGLIVLLIVAATGDIPYLQLFFTAAIIAVACGLGGDVMNDFRAGHVLETNPRSQWIGQAIGGVIGAVVAAAVVCMLVQVYGADAFGPGKDFVAAQAATVAATVFGMPSPTAFVVGIVIGCVLTLLKLPTMMLGLGVYLPFYMSITAFIGAVAKLIFDVVRKRRAMEPDSEELAAHDRNGLLVASGILGGESIVSLILAFVALAG